MQKPQGLYPQSLFEVVAHVPVHRQGGVGSAAR
jgi:hypothetical protein